MAFEDLVGFDSEPYSSVKHFNSTKLLYIGLPRPYSLHFHLRSLTIWFWQLDVQNHLTYEIRVLNWQRCNNAAFVCIPFMWFCLTFEQTIFNVVLTFHERASKLFALSVDDDKK